MRKHAKSGEGRLNFKTITSVLAPSLVIGELNFCLTGDARPVSLTGDARLEFLQNA